MALDSACPICKFRFKSIPSVDEVKCKNCGVVSEGLCINKEEGHSRPHIIKDHGVCNSRTANLGIHNERLMESSEDSEKFVKISGITEVYRRIANKRHKTTALLSQGLQDIDSLLKNIQSLTELAKKMTGSNLEAELDDQGLHGQIHYIRREIKVPHIDVLETLPMESEDSVPIWKRDHFMARKLWNYIITNHQNVAIFHLTELWASFNQRYGISIYDIAFINIILIKTDYYTPKEFVKTATFIEKQNHACCLRPLYDNTLVLQIKNEAIEKMTIKQFIRSREATNKYFSVLEFGQFSGWSHFFSLEILQSYEAEGLLVRDSQSERGLVFTFNRFSE